MGVWDWFSKEDAKEISDGILKEMDDDGEDYSKRFDKDSDKVIGKNLYPNDGTVGDHGAKSTFVHKILKNSFLDNIMLHFMKKHRDKLLKQVPDGYQFDDLRLFKEAYDDAIKEWCYKYQYMEKNEKGEAKGITNPDYPGVILPKPKELDEAKKHHDLIKDGRLGFMGEAYITVCANDSAYMEFHSFMMRSLQKRLKNLDPEHLLYIDSTINDPKYFIPVAVWTEEEKFLARQLMANNIRFVEIITLDDGSTSYKIDFKKIPNFVKNMPEGKK